MTRYWIILIPLLVFLGILTAKIWLPSNLYFNGDQSKTLTSTGDVVFNGNYFLPSDVRGHHSRKPPLVNWIAAVPVSLGLYHYEWALKLPSILGGMLNLGLVLWMCCWLAKRFQRKLEADPGIASSLPDEPMKWILPCMALAALFYMGGTSFIKHVYFMRPDMLHSAFMTLIWVSGTLAIDRETRRSWPWAILFWLGVGLAFLSKGPICLMAFAYLLIIVKPLTGSFRPLLKLGFWWGIPLSLAVMCVWVIPAAISNPDFFFGELLGRQVISRGAGQGRGFGHWAWRVFFTSKDIPAYFIERGAPSTALALIGIFWLSIEGLGKLKKSKTTTPDKNTADDDALKNTSACPEPWYMLQNPLWIPGVWILVNLLLWLPIAEKGGSFFMPTYAAAACMAAIFVCGGFIKLKWLPYALMGIPILYACLILSLQDLKDPPAKKFSGNRLVAFAREAYPIVKEDKVVFLNRDITPIDTLMGRHQNGNVTLEMLNETEWIVERISVNDPRLEAVKAKSLLISKPMERHANQEDGHKILVLYLANAQVPATQPH